MLPFFFKGIKYKRYSKEKIRATLKAKQKKAGCETRKRIASNQEEEESKRMIY